MKKISELSFAEYDAVFLPVVVAVLVAIFWAAWCLFFGSVPKSEVVMFLGFFENVPALSRWLAFPMYPTERPPSYAASSTAPIW